MTCIVGIETLDGRVILGADSAACNDSITMIAGEPKIFINGDFIIGYTTSFRFGQILQYSFKPPKHNRKITDHAYLCGPFIDAMRTILKDKGYTEIKFNVEEGGTALIGYRGKLYYLEGDFQIRRVHPACGAVGAGRYFAMGSLLTMKNVKSNSSMDTLKIALDVSSQLNPFVRPPFHFAIK